jgi:hypothetical protein
LNGIDSASNARQTTTSSLNGTAHSAAEEEQTQEIYLRGSASFPPVIPNERDHPLLTPEGKT